jgi:hypothetical protein
MLGLVRLPCTVAYARPSSPNAANDRPIRAKLSSASPLPRHSRAAGSTPRQVARLVLAQSGTPTCCLARPSPSQMLRQGSSVCVDSGQMGDWQPDGRFLDHPAQDRTVRFRPEHVEAPFVQAARSRPWGLAADKRCKESSLSPLKLMPHGPLRAVDWCAPHGVSPNERPRLQWLGGSRRP